MLLGLIASTQLQAHELQMVISAKAIHVGQNDLNENNYGVGFQYDFDEQQRWIPLINMASLKDSNNKTSRYIGAGIKRRFKLRAGNEPLNFDIGVAGLVMKRPDYNDEKPFWGALPFVSLNNSWGGVNATYVPAVEKDTLPFWYFQFTLKLLQF